MTQRYLVIKIDKLFGQIATIISNGGTIHHIVKDGTENVMIIYS